MLEYEEGYYYLFKNNSTTLHLDAELEFKMSNLHIVGFESATKVKVSLPPGSLQYVHLQRKDPTQNCNCEITQRFALNPPKAGKLPSVYVPVTYTADSPLDVLKAQTEKEGICTDHGTQDPAGLTIHQYQWVSGREGGIAVAVSEDAAAAWVGAWFADPACVRDFCFASVPFVLLPLALFLCRPFRSFLAVIVSCG